MSQKITAKNLTYDNTLPPFLARLRGQHVADSDSPDPLLASRRRAARVRSASEEAEDAPVVVDEQGNVVQLKGGAINEDGDLQQQLGNGEKVADNEQGSDRQTKDSRDAEKIAGIGAGKKRKLGRVVGGGGEEDNDAPSKESAKSDKTSKVDSKKYGGEKDARPTEKTKKKAKKIKLSFGDDAD